MSVASSAMVSVPVSIAISRGPLTTGAAAVPLSIADISLRLYGVASTPTEAVRM